jgi:hypothetical protein
MVNTADAAASQQIVRPTDESRLYPVSKLVLRRNKSYLADAPHPVERTTP